METENHGHLPVPAVQARANRSDRPEHSDLFPFTVFIAIVAGQSPLFAGIALVSVLLLVHERSIFRISYLDRSRSRKIAWYAASRIIQGGTMNRRFEYP